MIFRASPAPEPPCTSRICPRAVQSQEERETTVFVQPTELPAVQIQIDSALPGKRHRTSPDVLRHSAWSIQTSFSKKTPHCRQALPNLCTTTPSFLHFNNEGPFPAKISAFVLRLHIATPVRKSGTLPCLIERPALLPANSEHASEGRIRARREPLPQGGFHFRDQEPRREM
jgi:hypothetical protein